MSIRASSIDEGLLVCHFEHHLASISFITCGDEWGENIPTWLSASDLCLQSWKLWKKKHICIYKLSSLDMDLIETWCHFRVPSEIELYFKVAWPNSNLENWHLPIRDSLSVSSGSLFTFYPKLLLALPTFHLKGDCIAVRDKIIPVKI